MHVEDDRLVSMIPASNRYALHRMAFSVFILFAWPTNNGVHEAVHA